MHPMQAAFVAVHKHMLEEEEKAQGEMDMLQFRLLPLRGKSVPGPDHPPAPGEGGGLDMAGGGAEAHTCTHNRFG